MYQFINDRTVKVVSAIAACTAMVVVVMILFFLLRESGAAFSDIGLSRFVADTFWSPEPEARSGGFLIVPMIVGSVSVTTLSVLIALPLGVGVAVYSQLYAPYVLRVLTDRLIELWAGVPSVVLGLWGLVVLVPLIQRIHGHGASILAGSLVLAIMILPTVALSCRATFKNVVDEHYTHASALGLGKGSITLDILLPLSLRGIGVGVLLAGARALGETMVVLMLCGNVARMPGGIFDSASTLTATIALEMGYSYGAHRGALFFIGFLLMCAVLVLLAVSKAVLHLGRA